MSDSKSIPLASTDALTECAEPVEQLMRFWEQGTRIDVDTFIRTAGQLSTAQLAAVLRLDQRQRWQMGERITAESYLGRYPGLCADEEAAVDIIFHEFLLRQQRGERPRPEEYADRFPAYADVLQSQIALERALERDHATYRASVAGGSTASLPSHQRSPSGDANAQIGLVARGGLSSQWEIRPLLQKRLRLIALVTCPVFVLSLLVLWPKLVGPWPLLLYVTIAVGSSASAVLLSGRRPMSLRMLRWIEAGLVGGATLFFGWQDVQFFQGDWFTTLAERGVPGAMIAARCQGLPWVVMIISYGILIPNTARRCIVAVTLMVIIRLAIIFGLILTVPTVAMSESAAFVLGSVAEMGIAVAIAIFGAHRIETLQRVASEARKLGPYRLIKRLGAGGMGEVYLAEHALLRRPCALKLIRPEQGADAHFLSRFEREVQAMATLTHPNTVRIYDYGLSADGTFYYAMEYLPGLSLQELIARHGPLPPARAVYLLRQVCGALREAHAVGLVHRDIKPANILACQTGGMYDVAKLLDFGLVRVHSLSKDGNSLTGVGTIAGTPAFMSPEQAAGAAEVDQRSDIYSLGAVAYFLLTGRPPFVHSTSVETMAAHLSEPLVPLRRLFDDVSADLEAVVLRCLEKEPGRRFPDAAAVEEAIAHCACRDGWSWEQATDWWRSRDMMPSEFASADK